MLHVIPSLSEAHGGPTRATRLFELVLARAGVEVETATTADDRRRCFGEPERSVSDEGIVRWVFPRAVEFYKVSPSFGAWIWRHAADYDLVHIHALFSFTSVAAAIGARHCGVPYVLRPLGTLMRYGMQVRRPVLKRLSLKLVEGPLLRGAQAVHVTSSEERAQVLGLDHLIRCVTVPLAVECVGNSSTASLVEKFPRLRGRRIVLFIGRLDPVKNLESLLRAFARCHQEVPEAALLVAGEGSSDYRALLGNLSASLELGNDVIWAGHLAGELKAGALAAAEVFALPSYSESFGISAAEALGYGLPCVLGSGVAIAADVAAAGAGVVVPPQPEAIAKGLLQLLKDEPLRNAMAASARRFCAEQYSMEKMGESLIRMYTDVLTRAR